MDKITELANELGRALSQSAEYTHYIECRDACKANKALGAKIEEFNIQKAIMHDEATANDDTLAQSVRARMEKLYEEITSDPDMKKYNEAEAKMASVLDAINYTITSYITEEEESESAHSSCSGNCSACHGCH